MKYEIHLRSIACALFLFLGLITNVVYAQKLNECQKNVDDLVALFNQSIAEDRAEIIKSDDYQKKIKKLRACLKVYEAESFGPADSLRRINNEAIYNALATHYSKAIQVLRVLDLNHPDQQVIAYNRGQINLLNRNYAAAKEDLTNTLQMRQAGVNLLVAMGLDKKSKSGIEIPPPSSSTDSKWYYNYSVLLNERGNPAAALDAITNAIAIEDKERYHLFKGNLHVKMQAFELAKKEFAYLSSLRKKAGVGYGNAYLGLHEFKEAKSQYLNYVKSGDQEFIGEAYLGLAHSAYGMGEFEQAQQYYRQAGRYLPNELATLTGIANTYLSVFNYKSAHKYFEVVLLKDSLYYPAYVGRALANYSLGFYEQALHDFEKANPIFDSQDTFQANWHTTKGLSYFHLGQFTKAMSCFKTALEMDPKQFEALSGMSNILIKQKKFPLAGEYLYKAIQLAPTYDGLWSNYGNLLLHFGMFDKAYEIFTSAIEKNPKNLSAWNGLGVVLLEKDQIEQSVTLLDSIVKKNPTHGFLHNNLGIAHLYAANRKEWLNESNQSQKYYDLALADFNKGLELDTTKQFYHVNIGNVYRYTHLYQLADVHYRKHQDKSSLNNLAIVYGINNKIKEANYYIDIAMQIDTSNRVFRYNKLQLNTGEQVRSHAVSGSRAATDVALKYSMNGLVSINLYDYIYDEVKFPSRHVNHLRLKSQAVNKYMPSFELLLEPYQLEKKKEKKVSKISRRNQKNKMPKLKKKNATSCPVL